MQGTRNASHRDEFPRTGMFAKDWTGDWANEAMRESDHRIANNLQLLMAMLTAEMREISDPAACHVLNLMLGRVGAIAGVHRHLTRQPDSGTLDIGVYLETLCRQMELSCGDPAGARRLMVTTESVQVCTRLAAAIGLIASEAIMNACKHAYPPHAPGEVRIDLHRAGPHALYLGVEDDGAGRRVASGGFGSRLVATLASRIGAATIWEDAHPGTRFVLAVPLA